MTLCGKTFIVTGPFILYISTSVDLSVSQNFERYSNKDVINIQMELSTENCQFREMNIPTNDFPIKLDLCIKSIIEKESYIKYRVVKRCVSTNGGNYLGVLYEIDVNGRTEDGDKEQHIFVKHIIDSGALKMLSVSDVYKSEIFAYKELSKVFAGLQEKAKVPLEERYKMINIYEESDTEAIIMENVAKRGFTTYHRMDVVPIEFMELAVESLAKFHGLSFVIKEKRPDYFAEKIKSIKIPFVFKEDWKEAVNSMKDVGVNNADEKYKEKLENLYAGLSDKYAEYYNDETIKVCLCHGDYRPNNIMTKIKDGEVQEIIPVDYQIMHYGCPVFDFLYLIYVSTDRKFRKAHMMYLKDLYHKTLTNFLSYFDLDVEEIYSREEFEKVFKEKLDFGLMTAMMFLPFIFAPENDVPDITKEFATIKFQVDDKYKERLGDVIEDYVEWGYM